VIRPIAIAAACYKKWKGAIKFIDDFDDYTLTGIVISRPDLFVMAKATEHNGELAWFIRMLVGQLDQLIPALPPWPIEKICFCRHGDGRIRSYSIKRMLHLEKLKLAKKLANEQPTRLPLQRTTVEARVSRAGSAADPASEAGTTIGIRERT